MEYKEFCKMMEQKLTEYLPPKLPAVISLDNDKGRDFIKVTCSGSDVGMRIWLRESYELLDSGLSANEILMMMAEQVESSPIFRFRENWILNWKKARKKILPAAVKYDTAALKDVPFHRIEDIAIVCRAIIMGGNGAITVTDQLMEHWKVTKDELIDTAVKNGMFQYPLEVKPLGAAIKHLAGEAGVRLESEFDTSDKEGVYIAGAQNRFGAGVIAYRDFWEKCRKTVKSDFWLLPASIYEWLIIKDDGIRGGRELQGILKCCNQAALGPGEFLGDKVYHYSLTGEILESSENWMRRKTNAEF